MIDGQLRRVVMFPDDGHPDLASAVRDLTGDRATRSCCGISSASGSTRRIGRSPGARIYAPMRNPHYNDSNYRATCRCRGGPRRARVRVPGKATTGRGPTASEILVRPEQPPEVLQHPDAVR